MNWHLTELTGTLATGRACGPRNLMEVLSAIPLFSVGKGDSRACQTKCAICLRADVHANSNLAIGLPRILRRGRRKCESSRKYKQKGLSPFDLTPNMYIMAIYIDLWTECTGFNWDEVNINKNWEKHGVADFECEDVFFNQPFIVRHDAKHSQHEARFYALGRTDSRAT